MRDLKHSVVGALLAGAAAIALSAPSALAGIVFELDTEFSGADEPEGPPPWLRATFDTIGVDTVGLTMETIGLVEEENVDVWYFNLDPSLDPTALSIVYHSGQAADTVGTGTNAFKADGDGFFDICFEFPDSGDRFTGGEVSRYVFSGIAGLTEDSFNFPSRRLPQDEDTDIFSAAHIRSIDTTDNDNDGSGWISGGEGGRDGTPFIPVPPAAWGGMALLGGLGIHKKLREWRTA